MRTVWSLLVGLLLLFTASVEAREPLAAVYSCEGNYEPAEYRSNVVAEGLLRAISLVAPSNSFAKKVMGQRDVTYLNDLRWLYRDGIGRGETHTYILWGEVMVGLAMLWLLIIFFFYLPLMCFKWLRRRCCPFAWKRPRTDLGCAVWTGLSLGPIALFLVAMAILYSVYFLQDMDKAKCLLAHGVDAAYFGTTDWPGLEVVTQSGPGAFAFGIDTVMDFLNKLINHLHTNETVYFAVALTLIIVSALSFLGLVFAPLVFYHYWSYEEYTNPIKPPGGFCTNFAGFLTFGYGFWGSLLLLASGFGFAFLYFPSDFCRVVQRDLLDNGNWWQYEGIRRFTAYGRLNECLSGENVSWPDELVPPAAASIDRAELEDLFTSCGKSVCFEPTCRHNPRMIQSSSLKNFREFVQELPFDDFASVSSENTPPQFEDIVSCLSPSEMPSLMAGIERIILPRFQAEDFQCPVLHSIVDNTAKAPCNMFAGDLGALAWIFLGLAILNFVCWIFITRFYKARRRLMDGLKGDQSKEPEPIPVAAGGSSRITEDAFLLAAEQGDRPNVSLGMATYPPNTVYDLLYNNSPLHLAAYYGHEDIVDSLLKQGYDPNDLNFHDYTPFSACASNTYLDFEKKKRILQRLHAAGAELDTFDHQGDTALINATRSKDEELVKLLLEMGANPLVRDTMMGLTPLAVAETQRSPELIHLISEASPRGGEMASPKRTRFSESNV